MTDPNTRWQRINRILEAALELPPDQRAGFLDEACTDDPALRAEVVELLGYDEEQSGGLRASLDSAVEAMADEAPLIGSAVGAFTITRKIAEGGMGLVYEAERRGADFEQRVAIKLLPRHRMDAQAGVRFARERRILASLQHPNIAQLIDGGMLDDGLPYIVMEYVDGLSVDRYCRDNALGNDAIIHLLLKICDAVQYAHGKLVVHRDIKPGNILVDAGGAPKLLDFGIAKLLDIDGDVDAAQTGTGGRLFTPAYASPEQIEGGPITTAVDVYALGLLLYRLLTGRLPYANTRSDPRELERQIVSAPVEAPSDALASEPDTADAQRPHAWVVRQSRALRGDLDTIVLMALRKTPERRYPSVAAFADDLRRHLDKRPIRARPETLGYRLARFVGRHPVAVPVSALAVSAAIAASAGFTWMLAQQRDEALAAQAQASTAAEFAASLLVRNSASVAGARTMSVNDLLDDAKRRVDTELADEPSIALQLRLALATAYHSWGSYRQALDEAGQALLLAQAQRAERDQARALDLMATASHDLGELDRTFAYYQQAETLWRRIGSTAEHAQALSNVALSLNALRRRSEAAPAFQAALAKLREAHRGDHGDIAWLLNNLGWCLHAMGRFQEALPHYQEALAMQQRLGSPLVEIAATRSNLSGLSLDLGDVDAAERGWRLALTEMESIYGEGGHAGVARGQNLLARVLRERGRFTEALQLSGEALTSNRRLLGDRHRWTASTLVDHAMVRLDMDDLAAAERLLQEAADTVAALLGAEHADFSRIHLGRGLLALRRGDATAAEAELRAGQALIAALPSPDHVPIDDIELGLARAIALQGREGGLDIAATVVQRMRGMRTPHDWRLLAAEAAAGLPPFVAEPSAEARTLARETLDDLQQRIGPDAPRVRELSAALAGLPSP